MAMAVARGELLLIGEFVEFEQSEDVVLNREYRDRYATASCIICPLKAGGQVRGILNLADKVGGGRFDQDIDLPVVEQIAELIGSSIYHVELYREMERRAKTDALTELPNRRAVEEALAREIDRARRYGMRLSVVMIDVDELKTINDRFGHEAGDAVLTAFADAMTDAVRSVDVPGRWGGDEFLLVLPATGADQAEQLARRLFDSVRRHPVTTGSLVEYVTRLSIGVAELGPEEDLGQLIRRADEAMYEAKRAGRDRVALAEAHAPPAEADAPRGSASAEGAAGDDAGAAAADGAP
jgi:diguanylate cyclase (GGDEF)-like protein